MERKATTPTDFEIPFSEEKPDNFKNQKRPEIQPQPQPQPLPQLLPQQQQQQQQKPETLTETRTEIRPEKVVYNLCRKGWLKMYILFKSYKLLCGKHQFSNACL